MHPAVDLDVDGEGGEPCPARPLCKPFEELEAVDLGLEVVREEGLSHRELGVHDHDVRADTPIS